MDEKQQAELLSQIIEIAEYSKTLPKELITQYFFNEVYKLVNRNKDAYKVIEEVMRLTNHLAEERSPETNNG
jgi:hypothetical protein